MATGVWYLQAVAGQYTTTSARRVNWNGDTIIVSLHSTSYTPNQDADTFFSDTSFEISGGGYARQTLGTKSIGTNAGTNTVSLRAANTTFAALTNTFRYAVIWVDTAGASSTDPLLGYVDFGNQSVTATDVVISWDATDGVLKAVVS